MAAVAVALAPAPPCAQALLPSLRPSSRPSSPCINRSRRPTSSSFYRSSIVGRDSSSSSSSSRLHTPCSTSPPHHSPHIWLSDVPVHWRRPYFLNRHWAAEDFFIAGFFAALHALCLLAPFTFTWQAFGSFVLLYLVTGLLGITLSFHRNLSHKSFSLPKWLEYTFAYCGVLAMQGDPLTWVSSHRYHHQYCDTDKDPHSPFEGFWYSHMGWLLDRKSTIERVGARLNIGDIAKDPFYKFIKKTYPIHPILVFVGLYAWGGLPFLIWGGVVRTVWVYHITWLVNSASHVWGTQTWNTGDLSRNNWWVGLLAFGEGWHNNHHAFEYSARHGLEWWQVDLTWYFVWALEKVGLATKVKLPLKYHMEQLALKSS